MEASDKIHAQHMTVKIIQTRTIDSTAFVIGQ